MEQYRTFEEFDKTLEDDPRTFREYATANLAARLGYVIRVARLHFGHRTQSDMAAMMRTTQSGIARLEGGANVPTVETLARVSEALGQYLVIGVLDEGEVKEAGLFDKLGSGRVVLIASNHVDSVVTDVDSSEVEGIGLAQRFFGRPRGETPAEHERRELAGGNA
ncbi:MAG TPA: helix-turn-helix transcriptional regulator [Acidimicrobiales bacterium]|nr:helix-turn-helix transcriptional regulator [Acidimicrobiales bacterium]